MLYHVLIWFDSLEIYMHEQQLLRKSLTVSLHRRTPSNVLFYLTSSSKPKDIHLTIIIIE